MNKILKVFALAMMLLVISTVGASAYYYSGGYNSYGYNGHNTRYNNYGFAGYGGLQTTGLSAHSYLSPYASASRLNNRHVNPHYANYFDTHSYLRKDRFQRHVETIGYQQHSSPYVLVSSPYGKRPWVRPYGDNYPSVTRDRWNPFFGFPYFRSYSCHGPYSCHYHNVFPDSSN